MHQFEGKGEAAENLTYVEYLELKNYTKLPNIPKHADSISYSYYLFDDFLGDYAFGLHYVVPKEIKIDTFSFKNGSFTKTKTVSIINNLKYVSYSENKN